MAYRVVSDNDDKYFFSESDAEDWAEQERDNVHRRFCIDKEVPGPGECLCTRPDMWAFSREKQCAVHHYAETVKKHEVGECAKAYRVCVEYLEIN